MADIANAVGVADTVDVTDAVGAVDVADAVGAADTADAVGAADVVDTVDMTDTAAMLVRPRGVWGGGKEGCSHVSNPSSSLHQAFYGLSFPVHLVNFQIDLLYFLIQFSFFLGLTVSDAMQLHQATNGLLSTYPLLSAAQYPSRSYHCALYDWLRFTSLNICFG